MNWLQVTIIAVLALFVGAAIALWLVANAGE